MSPPIYDPNRDLIRATLRRHIVTLTGSTRDTDSSGCKANSASAAIKKWLKPRVPDGCVVHSLRHSLRDRLRRVKCPSDITDAISGWATVSVGQKYGSGYVLAVKALRLPPCGRRTGVTGVVCGVWVDVIFHKTGNHSEQG